MQAGLTLLTSAAGSLFSFCSGLRSTVVHFIITSSLVFKPAAVRAYITLNALFAINTEPLVAMLFDTI